MFCDIHLVGRLSKAPEKNTYITSTLACNLNVAYDSTQRKAGSSNYETCFISGICFGKVAETAMKYLEKGDLISVKGALTIKKAQKQDGSWAEYTSFAVERLRILKKAKGGQTKNEGDYQNPTPAPQKRVNQSGNPYQKELDLDVDDFEGSLGDTEIPF